MLAKPLYREGETVHYGYITGSLAVVGLLFVAPGVPAGIGNALGIDGQLVGIGVVAAILVGATLLASYSAVELMVMAWAFLTTSMAFTQLRFHYYLAVVVAVLNAYLFGEALRLVDLQSLEDLLDVDLWQVMTVVMVLLVITAPVLVVPLTVRNTGNAQFDSSQTAWQTAEDGGPGNIANWDGSLRWLSENTPAEGTLGGGESGMEYYGTYERTDDFSYPSGAYGVQSWWDYGHWITVRGERIPNANPFQEGATAAANYLLAPNETAAEDVLASQSSEGENTRYVMVDWQMATPGSKFGAPVVFYDAAIVSQSDFYAPVYASRDDSYNRNFQLRTQRYYESQMVRLYEYHGSAMEPQPVVVDWVDDDVTNRRTGEEFTIRAAPTGNESVLKTFDNVTAAREYAEEDGSAQVGGIGPYPSERVPALEHYRLTKASNRSALRTSGYVNQLRSTLQVTGLRDPSLLYRTQPSWVKTFERVPGATIEGSNARPNATVTAVVGMRVPTTGETFQYRQQTRSDENGEFTMTLPYSTTGYDRYGPENGYTNVSVRATADHYVFRGGGSVQTVDGTPMVVQRGANVTVPEGKVNGDDAAPIEVELEERSEPLQVRGGSGSSGQNDLDELPASTAPPVEATDDGPDAAAAPSARRPADIASPTPVAVAAP
jgi:dolichyl-diphosphooligosaccharide--protein glycosyltransferase